MMNLRQRGGSYADRIAIFEEPARERGQNPILARRWIRMEGKEAAFEKILKLPTVPTFVAGRAKLTPKRAAQKSDFARDGDRPDHVLRHFLTAHVPHRPSCQRAGSMIWYSQ